MRSVRRLHFEAKWIVMLGVATRIILILMLMSAFGIRAIDACQPIIPRHPYRDSKAVFFGELVNLDESTDRCTWGLRFKVERYWKGKLTEYVSVQTESPYCCGYNFQVGKKYLIYAYLEKGRPLATSIGWTFAHDTADEQLKKLGKGKVIGGSNG